MNNEDEFEHVTTNAFVEVFKSSGTIFEGLLREVRILSGKKPEATMSASKVTTINRVLHDLRAILEKEPEGKYLDLLDDKSLPQMSDAVFAMVQYESALRKFSGRYHKRVHGDPYWITEEVLAEWEKDEELDSEDDDDDYEDDEGDDLEQDEDDDGESDGSETDDDSDTEER